MSEYSENLTETDVEAVLRATIERLIEDAMIDAEVDYPAGSDAGHRISWDSDSLLNGIMALIPAPAPAEQDPVAVIGKDYRLLWSDAGSMSEIVAKHRITVGSPLYAHPAPVPAVPDDVAKVRNALRSHSYIRAIHVDEVLAGMPTNADAVAQLVEAARTEAEKAMRKFPQPNYVISKVAEEAGEVVKAAIHCAEGREKPENVKLEIVQAIAMLIRLYVEGDQVHGLPAIAAMETSHD